jgi:hypothetical protein
MSIFELLFLCLLIGAAWLWYDSMQVRDIALRAARSACAAEGLQLLDETVAIAGVALARNDDGQMQLRRAYGFDYSDTGNNRCRGRVILLGSSVEVVNVGVRNA